MESIGARIRKARESLHLTQEYLAKEVNINRTAMVQIENGKRGIDSTELAAFSKILGISADELLNGRRIRIPENLFTRAFSELDEADQNEIMNLIEFKKQMKAKNNL